MRANFTLTDAADTARLGARLAAVLGPGDIVLLSGPVGAGKSHLARALIQQAQRQAEFVAEDVPSPSFTLVQTYDAGSCEIWHCDLYRLSDADDLAEIGLAEAFDSAITLIEWPDLVRAHLGARYMEITLRPDDEDAALRHAEIVLAGGGWDKVVTALKDRDGGKDAACPDPTG